MEKEKSTMKINAKKKDLCRCAQQYPAQGRMKISNAHVRTTLFQNSNLEVKKKQKRNVVLGIKEESEEQFSI